MGHDGKKKKKLMLMMMLLLMMDASDSTATATRAVQLDRVTETDSMDNGIDHLIRRSQVRDLRERQHTGSHATIRGPGDEQQQLTERDCARK
jgi:hypothetical protein